MRNKLKDKMKTCLNIAFSKAGAGQTNFGFSSLSASVPVGHY